MAFPGTYVNGPTLGVAGLVTGDPDTAVTFDPANDEYAVSDDTFPQQTLTAFTIGGIVKLNSLATEPSWWGFVGAGALEIDLRFDNTNDHFGVAFAPGSTFTGFASMYGDTVVTAGPTYRVIATWDGTTVKLYVNGALDGGAITGNGSIPPSGTGGSCPFDSAKIIDGGGSGDFEIDEDLNFYAALDQFSTTGNFSLDGSLDELFFVANHAATAPEIAAIDAAMTGTGDVATEINALSPDVYWRLGEASGTVVVDSAGGPPPEPSDATYPQLALSADFESGTEDITEYVEDFPLSIVRGSTAQSVTGYVADAGTLSDTLQNANRTFDPLYTLGPFFGDLVPGVPIRAVFPWNAVNYQLFAGTADGWPQNYPRDGVDQLVDLRATDALAFFAGAAAEIQRPAEKTGERFAAICAALDYPGATDIATGSSYMPALVRGTAVSLSSLADCVQVEWGEGYVSKDEVLTFRGRKEVATEDRSKNSQATFVQSGGLNYTDLTRGSPQIYNEVVISYSDTGKQVTVRDDVSVAMPWSNGVPKSLPLSLPMMTRSQAKSYARWILLQYAYPIQTVTSIRLEPFNTPGATFDLWAQCLSRELGDRITVILDPTILVANQPELSGEPIERDCVIRGIQHDFTEPFSTTFYLQDQTWMDNLFIWDTSELDGPHFYGM